MPTRLVHLELPAELYDALYRLRSAEKAQRAAAENAVKAVVRRPLPMADWVSTTAEGKLALNEAVGIAHRNPTRIGGDQANSVIKQAYKAYYDSFPKRKPGRPKTIISVREASLAVRDELTRALIDYLVTTTTQENSNDKHSDATTFPSGSGGAEAAGVSASAQ